MGTTPTNLRVEQFRAMYRRALGLEGAIASDGGFGVSDSSETPKPPSLARESGAFHVFNTAPQGQTNPLSRMTTAPPVDLSATTFQSSTVAQLRAEVETAAPRVRVWRASEPEVPRKPRKAKAPRPGIETPVHTADELLAAARARGARLSKKARAVYRVIYDLMTQRHQQQGRKYAGVPQLVDHLSGELIAVAAGCCEASYHNAANALQRAGLLKRKSHQAGEKGKSRSTGTLYALALIPDHTPHFRHDHWQHQWRDVEADKAEDRTAYALVKKIRESQALRETQQEMAFKELLFWAVNLGTQQSSVSNDPLNSAEPVWALEDAVWAHPQKRGAAINVAAVRLARALNDMHSVNMYRWLLWRVLDMENQGLPALRQLQNEVQRVLVDVQEGWARKPGALLRARLGKEWFAQAKAAKVAARAA